MVWSLAMSCCFIHLAIVQALLEVLGETHTSENTDPATWQNPPVPESWWSVIREQSPGFDPVLTPASRWMGILAETIRTWPGAVRSDHPQVRPQPDGSSSGSYSGPAINNAA